MKNNNKKKTTASILLLVSVTLMIGATAAMTVTLAPVNIVVEQAYAQLVEIEQEAESENGVHTGSISIKVEPQGEPDDEPAHRGEMTLKLPNDRIMFRVIESADESSNIVQSTNILDVDNTNHG